MHRNTLPATAAVLTLTLAGTGLLGSALPASAADETPALDLAMALGYVPTFGAAVANTDLVVELRQPGPFTVFVPSEGAFARLPAGTLEDLQRPENRAALADLLRHHIVAGRIMASDLAGTSRLQTLAGSYLEVSSDGLAVNGSRITTADELTANGVFHVVDTVILPPG
jgi:uncharacterized surface protein with fasciclin (FAS1) repeats